MSLELFRRPARRPGPDMPQGELTLQEPPTLPEAQADTSAVWTFLPMGMMSASMLVMFLRPGENSAFSYIAMGMMVLSMVAMLVGQVMRGRGERKRRTTGERRDYLRYLAQVRKKVRRAMTQQQEALVWRHPDPAVLWSMVRTSRLWERRSGDEDFAEVRIAVGDQRLGVRLSPVSTKPVEDLEPLSAHALRRFIRAYSSIPDQPVAVALRAWSKVLTRGAEEPVRGTARALVAQLAAFHAPEDLWVALCVSDERRSDWEWLKWLPHSQHPHDRDGAGPVRLVAPSISELEVLLGAEFQERPAFDPDAVPGREEPFTVLVMDGGRVPAGHRLDGQGFRNCVVWDLSGTLTWRPGRSTLRLDFADEAVCLVRTDRSRQEQTTALGRPDRMGPAAARALAALVAPYRLSLGTDSTEPLATDVQLTTLLGIPDLHTHDPAAYWAGRSGAERLRVPIAVGADGAAVELDIKESAQGGMGPHGMLIGATGSGKSELLRTLVLGLALRHSSQTLNFVLVDFKGGATFLGLDELPHTSAVITNLADEVALVSRMQDALHGELIRRQELLRAAGNYTSALEYEKARAAGSRLDPLPSLFVVVDEFSELLAAHAEFMELFVMIGRLGRSLGVHLLLASQRLDEGRMHQLESHLSYRIGLRTFSAMESRGVLGVPDAYQLPPQPGSGYLKSGVEALTRFRAAYVSGPYRRRRGALARAQVAGQVTHWSVGWVAPRDLPEPPRAAAEEEPSEQSLLSTAVDRLRDSGPPARQVWLPPLGLSPTLDQLLPPLVPDAERGLTIGVGGTGTDAVAPGGLRVPVGIVDRPFEQRRDPLIVDLSGAGGHVAIAGGPQSGKSTLLRTLITAVALTHTPREVQFYCLDFGGGGLAGLAGLPHVGGVAAHVDGERIGRTVAAVASLLAERERFFLEHGIDSMTTYRKRRAAGDFPDEPYGDVFLVVDGWGTLRQDFLDHVATLSQFAMRGLNYGVHLVVTTARWVELAAQVRDQVGTRLELKMGDPMESVIDIRRARSVPRVPGRGLAPENKLHFLAALPRLDSAQSQEDLAEGLAKVVQAVDEHWRRPAAPPVRMLPVQLSAAELPPSEGDLRIALGVEEDRLGPAWHDFAEHPHLVVVGDNETGKTNLLRLVAKGITDRYTPAEVRILVVDYRRELVDAIPEAYRLGHAVSVDQLRELAVGTGRALSSRMPGSDIAPSRMKLRDWWEGPTLFVLVDDYDLISAPLGRSPFEPLLDFLALGYEVGFHMVVTRSAAGAGRGLGDPVLRRMLEINTPGLLMSCPPSEGYLFGSVKPRVLVPGRALRITRRTTVQVQTALLAKD